MLATARQSAIRYRDRARLPIDFDAGRLQAEVAEATGSGWIDHFVRQNFDGEWSVIPLRIGAGNWTKHPVLQIFPAPGVREYEDGPLLARMPYLREAIAAIPCDIQTVRLMKLAAGSIIKPHTDDDLGIEHGFARLHVPVITNDEVDFRLNGERVVMDAGSVWYLRLSDTHSVANRSATDRIHLVIDCVANDWLRSAAAA
ncbi:aspartyl/asparaginyl beta-hydroxylase domain-containing protein [Sphingomonas hylomeconis]|uniref:Aspartyl/asparaginyl beta-hydroxylase domain-containing protein n=1 Tax=Sphingomonas hylomeconis TaxID=1395958 RepID=A0ABV7SXL8_9SPHN|nr:aspartyl/asparaginyl beta-hydroxylase domain-containing protein [Sphingomonas hylomeconis]